MVATTSKARNGSESAQCVICDRLNSDFDNICGRCMAPAELTRSVLRRGTPARFVAVLGESAAGKTVYLGMLLDMLSKGSRGLRGFPNGTFSIAVQQETMTALQDRLFPEKTASEADNWKWVHCEVSKDGKGSGYLDVITPDFAGEAIALEVEQPGTYPTIRAMVKKAASLLVLIDSQRARDAGREEDYFGLKLASYISTINIAANAKRGKKLDIPIVILFTKADTCPEARENPSQFAAANLPGLTNYCERHFEKHAFFSTGVVGGTATVMSDHGFRMQIPLHVEPRGILEPLEWIMKHI
jgi:Double-GTPase 1